MSRKNKFRKLATAAAPQHPQMPQRQRREPVTRALTQRWVYRLVPVLVALVTFAAFLPALQNQFVSFDDDKNFLDNPHYRGLAWTHLRWMWTTHQGHYIPLTWMTLGLDYLLWGMNPVGYHLTNLLLHAANAVVFFFVVRRILTLALPSPAERGHALAVSAGSPPSCLRSIPCAWNPSPGSPNGAMSSRGSSTCRRSSSTSWPARAGRGAEGGTGCPWPCSSVRCSRSRWS